MSKTYSEKLKDDRWLSKRREILERDKFTCQCCGNQEKVMHVHHEFYFINTEPWNYPNEALVTLCDSCHSCEESGRKDTYKNLCRAISDAGFTREDVEKLTQAFELIRVKPMYSYILTSMIYRSISKDWYNFDARSPLFIADDEETEIHGSDGVKSIGELISEKLAYLERRIANG